MNRAAGAYKGSKHPQAYFKHNLKFCYFYYSKEASERGEEEPERCISKSDFPVEFAYELL